MPRRQAPWAAPLHTALSSSVSRASIRRTCSLRNVAGARYASRSSDRGAACPPTCACATRASSRRTRSAGMTWIVQIHASTQADGVLRNPRGGSDHRRPRHFADGRQASKPLLQGKAENDAATRGSRIEFRPRREPIENPATPLRVSAAAAMAKLSATKQEGTRRHAPGGVPLGPDAPPPFAMRIPSRPAS